MVIKIARGAIIRSGLLCDCLEEQECDCFDDILERPADEEPQDTKEE